MFIPLQKLDINARLDDPLHKAALDVHFDASFEIISKLIQPVYIQSHEKGDQLVYWYRDNKTGGEAMAVGVRTTPEAIRLLTMILEVFVEQCVHAGDHMSAAMFKQVSEDLQYIPGAFVGQIYSVGHEDIHKHPAGHDARQGITSYTIKEEHRLEIIERLLSFWLTIKLNSMPDVPEGTELDKAVTDGIRDQLFNGIVKAHVERQIERKGGSPFSADPRNPAKSVDNLLEALYGGSERIESLIEKGRMAKDLVNMIRDMHRPRSVGTELAELLGMSLGRPASRMSEESPIDKLLREAKQGQTPDPDKSV